MEVYTQTGAVGKAQPVQKRDPARLTMTVREAAGLTGIGTNKLYTLTWREDFPAIRIGRKVLIVRAGLEEWLAQVARGEIEID